MATDGAEREREAVRIAIDAAAETVWTALREPHEIERWHGWHYDELEAEIDAIFLSDVTEHPEELTLDTNGGGRFELERADDADGPHTVLRIVRGLDQYGTDWDGGYDEIDEGWTTFVHQLRFLLERHPGQDRRTLRIDDDRPSTATVWQLLGFEHLVGPGGPGVGERYEARVPAAGGTEAEDISGEIWFRTEHQVGLTVDEWGDGLLVVADERDPERPGSVLVTTFGDDHEAFERRHEAWQDRWFAVDVTEPDAV